MLQVDDEGLAPPAGEGCNTIIKTNLCVSPAHLQPYTRIYHHVQEAEKMSGDHKTVWCRPKVMNCGISGSRAESGPGTWVTEDDGLQNKSNKSDWSFSVKSLLPAPGSIYQGV